MIQNPIIKLKQSNIFDAAASGAKHAASLGPLLEV